jgi:hypothetical protein
LRPVFLISRTGELAAPGITCRAMDCENAARRASSNHNEKQRTSESMMHSREIEEIFLRILQPLCHYTDMEHVSDHDLERCYLGTIADEAELAPLEEHLLGCPVCVERAEKAAEYVDTLRAAMIAGNFDLE